MSDAYEYNGHQIPAFQTPAWAYSSAMIHKGQAWVSGSVPKTGDADLHPGLLGRDVSIEQAQEAAELSLRNALASLSHAIGGLDHVEQMLKMTVFVASTADFTQQPRVAEAASKLLREILGDRGAHARSAVGVASLPRNSCVEIELVAAVNA